MGKALLEKGGKFRNHVISNEIVYGSQSLDPDLEPAVASRNWFADYNLGRIWFEVNFVSVRERDPQFSAIIKFAPRAPNTVFADHVARQRYGIECNRPMLVNDAKPVQDPKGMLFKPCTSVIRLKRLNDLDGLREDVLDGFSQPSVLIVANRKGSGFARARHVQSSKLPSELIQARSKTISKLTNEHGDAIGIGFISMRMTCISFFG